MPQRLITYDGISDVTYGDLNPVPPGESRTIEWSNLAEQQDWTGSVSGVPTQTPFGLSGAAYRIWARVGWELVNPGTGTVTLEILVNGSAQGSIVWNVATFTGNPDVFTTGYPALLQGTAGYTVQIKITNDSNENIELGDVQTEVAGFVTADEFYGGNIPITELCDEVVVTQTTNDLDFFTPSTLTSDGSAALIDFPWDVTYETAEIIYTSESEFDGDNHNYLEKLTSRISSGEFWTDASLNAGSPMAVRAALGYVWVLAYTSGNVLTLYKIDTLGTLVISWAVQQYGAAGTFIFLEIARNGKAYYTELDAVDGSNVARLLVFNTVTGLQAAPALEISNTDPTQQDWLGAFKLLRAGGAVISHSEFVDSAPDFRRVWLDVYDKNAVLITQIPTEDGEAAGISPEPTAAVCFGETSAKIVYGVSLENVLYKVDLNTLVLDGSFDPGHAHNEINSCDIGLGPGFGGRRRPDVSVVGF